LGKAMLAFRDSDPTAGAELRRMTGETVVDPSELAARLVDVRRTGIATEHDEALLGESSVAAPVFDATGLVVGAIGVVLQSSDWPPPGSLHDDVREAARNISRELGAAGWPMYTSAIVGAEEESA
jgi:DNA-binding IclR family transcriptional regulator